MNKQDIVGEFLSNRDNAKSLFKLVRLLDDENEEACIEKSLIERNVLPHDMVLISTRKSTLKLLW